MPIPGPCAGVVDALVELDHVLAARVCVLRREDGRGRFGSHHLLGQRGGATRLLARANAIADPETRHAFLTLIPDHRSIFRLALEWELPAEPQA